MSTTITGSAGNGAFIYSSSPNTNNGSHASLYVGDNGSGVKYRAVVKFPFGELPDNISAITSATLRLYLAAAPTNTRVMSVYRVLKNWVEAGVTYNSYASGSSWDTAGAYDSGDIDMTASGSISISSSAANGYKDISLDTTVVYNMIKGIYNNYGWLLKMATESADRVTFNSDDATNKPLLVLEYTVSSGGRKFQVIKLF